jgi:hypothetical protein
MDIAYTDGSWNEEEIFARLSILVEETIKNQKKSNKLHHDLEI